MFSKGSCWKFTLQYVATTEYSFSLSLSLSELFCIQVLWGYKGGFQQRDPKPYTLFKRKDLVLVHQMFLMQSLCSVFSVVKKLDFPHL